MSWSEFNGLNQQQTELTTEMKMIRISIEWFAMKSDELTF